MAYWMPMTLWSSEKTYFRKKPSSSCAWSCAWPCACPRARVPKVATLSNADSFLNREMSDFVCDTRFYTPTDAVGTSGVSREMPEVILTGGGERLTMLGSVGYHCYFCTRAAIV